MSENNKVDLLVQSEEFVPDHPQDQSISFRLNLSLGTSKDILTKTDEQNDEESIADTLFIKFRSSEPVPDEVKDFVTNTLGTFDLVENEDEKTFIFELKIKDINIDEIKNMYSDYIENKAEDFGIVCEYTMSQNFDSLFEQLKAKYRVPLMMHLSHKARFSLTMDNQDKLLKAILAYAKMQNVPVFDFVFNAVSLFKSVKGNCQLASINDFDEQMMEELNWDQRENIKEVFGSLDNPINRFIFSDKNPNQQLEITGRILNSINYSFTANLSGLPDFLKKCDSLN